MSNMILRIIMVKVVEAATQIHTKVELRVGFGVNDEKDEVMTCIGTMLLVMVSF